MNNRKVIIIATHQPLDNDARVRRRMESTLRWAERQGSRYSDLDLPAIQKGVNQNMLKLFLNLEGRFVDLLDLMNYLTHGRDFLQLTPHNLKQYYSLADRVTHNGIYLYQYLRDRGFDPILVQNDATSNLPDILKENPLAVCISSNFIFMDDIREIAVLVKKQAPSVPVIAGGILVKRLLDPGEGLSADALGSFSDFHNLVDAFVVEAQGEQSLVHLLHALMDGGEPKNIPNLAIFNAQGKMRFTPRRKEYIDMDETVIDWKKIPGTLLRDTLPVNSSRGCFYRCRFCTYHWLFPEVRYKSLDVLKKELRDIEGLGLVRHVRFTDDNFTANKKRLKAVLEMMIREGLHFTWSSYARAGALTPELVKLMKASGCEFLDLGLESGSQTMLDNMDKRLKREQALSAIKILNDQGIYSRGSFIIGYPGETRETFSETLDFINDSALPYYHPYLFSYSRRALIHQERERYGLKGLGVVWKHDTMDAVEASRLISRMIERLPRGFTDGQANVEEIHTLLRGKGYSPREIYELFELKRGLQLAINGNNEEAPLEAESILRVLESKIKISTG